MSETEHEHEPDTDGPADDDTAAEEAQEALTDDAEAEETPEAEEGHDTPEAAAKDVARVDAALSRAAKNYVKKLTDIFGEDWMGWRPCPLCAEHAPGLISPMPPSEAAIAETRPLIGLPDLSTYVEDRFARVCDRCQGRGKTLTGSKVPEYATIRCQDCNGTGFQSADPALTSQTNGVLEAVPLPPTHTEPEPAYELPPDARKALEKMLAGSEVAAATGPARYMP